MKEGRIRPSLLTAVCPTAPAPRHLNEGGSNSTLVDQFPGNLPAQAGTSMKEGRIRPSLAAIVRIWYSDIHTSMKEGRIRPSLFNSGILWNRRGTTSMKEGRIRPSLFLARWASSAINNLNEGGSNSTLVERGEGVRLLVRPDLNEGGSNSTLVVNHRFPKSGMLSNLNEGGSNSTLVVLDLWEHCQPDHPPQ